MLGGAEGPLMRASSSRLSDTIIIIIIIISSLNHLVSLMRASSSSSSRLSEKSIGERVVTTTSRLSRVILTSGVPQFSTANGSMVMLRQVGVRVW